MICCLNKSDIWRLKKEPKLPISLRLGWRGVNLRKDLIFMFGLFSIKLKENWLKKPKKKELKRIREAKRPH